MIEYVVPKLRTDLAYESFEENDEKYFVIVDPKGYAEQPIALPAGAMPIISLLDGNRTVSDLISSVRAALKVEVNTDFFIDLLKNLDSACMLESPSYFLTKWQHDEYISRPSRPPICVGNSYPPMPDALQIYLENLLESEPKRKLDKPAKALIVPHIDFNIGELTHQVYSAGYQSIESAEPELVVIFGTSHRANSDYFMLSEKDYDTPLGLQATDKDIIASLKQSTDAFTLDDMAHRYEHSIELQIVLLQQMFKRRPFKVLPILVGSFQRHVYDKSRPIDNPRISTFISALKTSILNSGKNVLYLASVDFAHIGRKFGDEFDAEPVLDSLRSEDMQLIDYLKQGDAETFFSQVSSVLDHRKICGLSPIYAMLKTFPSSNGELLKYNQWNETETASAVSFASIGYF